MARMLCSKPCWAKAVSLSKVIDLRSASFMRAKFASMTEMVSAAVFPASRAARVTRDLRSWRTSTGDWHAFPIGRVDDAREGRGRRLDRLAGRHIARIGAVAD